MVADIVFARISRWTWTVCFYCLWLCIKFLVHRLLVKRCLICRYVAIMNAIFSAQRSMVFASVLTAFFFNCFTFYSLNDFIHCILYCYFFPKFYLLQFHLCKLDKYFICLICLFLIVFLIAILLLLFFCLVQVYLSRVEMSFLSDQKKEPSFLRKLKN